MSKYYIFLIILVVSFYQPVQAQTTLNSDTIYLQTGEQDISFNFPETSFYKVNFYLYTRLNENCHFTNGEFLSFKIPNDQSNSDISKIEFARVYLASYSDNRQEGNEIIYEFDLTLWQSLLERNTSVTVDFSGKTTDLEMAISFHLEQGIHPVNVIGIFPLWQSSIDGFAYGKNGVSEELLPTKNIELPKETSSAFVNILVSGTKKQNSDAAASRFYFLNINGEEVAKRSIWRDDCGLNPIYPQHENWEMNHHNWCSGLRVNPLAHYIDPNLLNDKVLDIDLRFQKDYYENSGVESYITSAVLFALGEPNEELNVSISEIIAPNIDLWHHRYNPICGSPIILIQNNGKETVKSITFNYGYNYDTDNKYRWKGELGFMEQEIVYLPSLNWYFYERQDEPESFTAHVTTVNGKEKAFNGGKKTSIMELAPVYPYRLAFEVQTDDGAQYNGLEIYNEDGKVVFVSEELQANKKHQFELNLVPGCYEMIFYDEEGNGIQLTDNKAFCLRIKDRKKGLVLKEFHGDFGLEIREQFMIFR